MICTFYSSNAGYDDVIEVLQTVLPKAKITTSVEDGMRKIHTSSGGLFSTKSGLKLSYRERIDFDSPIEGAAANCGLSQNLTGLYNFVSSFPSNNPKIRQLMMMKIRTVKSEFSLQQVKGETDNLAELVKALAKHFDSLIFAQAGTKISKANGQHFLNEKLELVLDNAGNSSIDNLGPTIEALYQEREKTYKEQVLGKLNEDQRERKLANEKSLQELGIQVNKFLPAIETEAEIKLRSIVEVAQRATMLSLINVFASGHITNEQVINTLKSKDLWKFATVKEKDLMENPTDEKKSHETWKCEGIWTLLWALKKVDELGNPANMCDLGNVPQDQYPLHDPIGFLNGHHELRSKKEIADANDFYYRMNWACVNARIKGQQMTRVNPGVVYERHYALNWLINYMGQAWDDVSTET